MGIRRIDSLGVIEFMRIKHFIGIIILIPLIFSCFGCGKAEYTSLWRNREIIIDGKDNEWQDAMVEKDKVFLGAMNDKDNLYVCISTEDKSTKAQLLGMFGQTVTLWFYNSGVEEKKIGIRFKNEDSMATSNRSSNMDEAFNRFQSKLNSYQVINSLESAQSIPTNNTFEIKTGYANDKLVLEMKMPLIIQSVLDLSGEKNKHITFGVETSEIAKKNIQNERDNSASTPQSSSMGMGGGRGHGMGGSHGGRHSGVSSLPSRLQISVTIALASESILSTPVPIVPNKTSGGTTLAIPAPISTQLPPDIISFKVLDSKGEEITVMIKKTQGGYTGPQGEFYSEIPSLEQLKVMYGNK